MKKLNLIIVIIATVLTVAGIWFYTHFSVDFKQLGITAGASLIISSIYFSRRRSIKSKAASTAVRKSAGMSAVKRYANKMLITSIIATTAILIGTKSFHLLIPMGVTIATYILFRLFNVKLFVLISYISTILCALLFVTAADIPISDRYVIAYRVLSFQIFLFYLLSAADLYCAEK